MLDFIITSGILANGYLSFNRHHITRRKQMSFTTHKSAATLFCLIIIGYAQHANAMMARNLARASKQISLRQQIINHHAMLPTRYNSSLPESKPNNTKHRFSNISLGCLEGALDGWALALGGVYFDLIDFNTAATYIIPTSAMIGGFRASRPAFGLAGLAGGAVALTGLTGGLYGYEKYKREIINELFNTNEERLKVIAQAKESVFRPEKS